MHAHIRRITATAIASSAAAYALLPSPPVAESSGTPAGSGNRPRQRAVPAWSPLDLLTATSTVYAREDAPRQQEQQEQQEQSKPKAPGFRATLSQDAARAFGSSSSSSNTSDGLTPMMRAAGYSVVRPGVLRLPDGREMDERVFAAVLEARAHALGNTIKCKVCAGQSVEESNSDEAIEIREVIRRSMFMGLDEQQTTDLLVARYGESVLLSPRVNFSKYALYSIPGVIALSLLYAAISARRVPKPPRMSVYLQGFTENVPVTSAQIEFIARTVSIPDYPKSFVDKFKRGL